jgi:hypothetical protein
MLTPTHLRYNLKILSDRPERLSANLVFAECVAIAPDVIDPIVPVGGKCCVFKDAWVVIETSKDSDEPSLVTVDDSVIVQIDK